MVGSFRLHECLFYPGGDPFLGSSSDIQLHAGVNSVNAFMIPHITHVSDPIITHPKSNGWMYFDQSSKQVNDLTIIFFLLLALIC
jgi:hypothetical protein